MMPDFLEDFFDNPPAASASPSPSCRSTAAGTTVLPSAVIWSDWPASPPSLRDENRFRRTQRGVDLPPRRGETIEEYRQRMRERYATDPEYRERRRVSLREGRRQRYATDPDYREQFF